MPRVTKEKASRSAAGLAKNRTSKSQRSTYARFLAHWRWQNKNNKRSS